MNLQPNIILLVVIILLLFIIKQKIVRQLDASSSPMLGKLKVLISFILSLLIIAGLIIVLLEGLNWFASGPSLDGTDARFPLSIDNWEIVGLSEEEQQKVIFIDAGSGSWKNLPNKEQIKIRIEDDGTKAILYGGMDNVFNGQYGTWFKLDLGTREAPFNMLEDLYGECYTEFWLFDRDGGAKDSQHPNIGWGYNNSVDPLGIRLNIALGEKSFQVHDIFRGSNLCLEYFGNGITSEGRYYYRQQWIFVSAGKEIYIKNLQIK